MTEEASWDARQAPQISATEGRVKKREPYDIAELPGHTSPAGGGPPEVTV